MPELIKEIGKNEPELNKKVEENGEAECYIKSLLNEGSQEFASNGELTLPEWYNPELISKAQTYLIKFRLMILDGMLTGLVAVLAIPSILKVLIATKQSHTEPISYKRYGRTIFHTISWFQAPFKPESKSWKSIEIVRKAHFKSSLLSDKLNNGKITQKDLALTQFGFMAFYVLEIKSIGFADDEFFESTFHFWRLIGHLLGIKDEYNLCASSSSVTLKRLDYILKTVFKPALESPPTEFNEMTKTLINSLKPSYRMLDWETSIFCTKNSTKCAGYEYYNDEDFGDASKKLSEYYKLKFGTRFSISCGMFITKYLYPIDFVRKFFNFRLWILELWAYYLPYNAIWKYGRKIAFIRIFDDKNDENKLHKS